VQAASEAHQAFKSTRTVGGLTLGHSLLMTALVDRFRVASGVTLAVPVLGGAVEQHGPLIGRETGEDVVVGGIQRPEA